MKRIVIEVANLPEGLSDKHDVLILIWNALATKGVDVYAINVVKDQPLYGLRKAEEVT